MTKKSKKAISFGQLSKRNKIIALSVAVLVVLAGVVFITIRAAGFFTATEPESAALTTNAKILNDVAASGGQAIKFTAPSASTPPAPSAWPDATNTGYEPTGVTLHTCATTITTSGTYDSCQFDGDVSVRASNVKITRSLIKGTVHTGSVEAGKPVVQTGLVISDTTINCGCKSVGSNDTPSAIEESNYTLLRVNLYNSGHGAAIQTNVTIQDSYIHDLGGNTLAHKDGIFSGGGTNVTIRHNNIECNDGSLAGCTAAIGLLSDFEPNTYHTIDNNLLNTNGASCFYAWGGPQKPYKSSYITFTNNHFGRKINGKCGDQGPVAYWDATQPGMVWSGNVWDDTGEPVPPSM